MKLFPLIAAAALAASPAAAQPGTLPADAPQAGRNFDPSILAYAGFPLLIVIILVIAASSSGDDSPTSP